jgi:hypothetical protein
MHLLAASIQLTLALEVLLVCCEGTIPAARKLLPLGRSHLAQLGLLLGLAVCGVEFTEALSHFVLSLPAITSIAKATEH